VIGAPAAERELVERAVEGDRRALDELLQRYEPTISRLCRARLRSPDDAADAVQETFERALTRLHQLRSPDAFGGWVCTIAARVCADHGRRRSRERWTALSVDEPDVSALPDEVVEAAEDSHRVHRALQDLAPRDRQALWLRHGVEAPIAQIAAELGVTEGSARVLLTRARHRLRAAAAGLAGLVPLPLRQWTREHVSPWLNRLDVSPLLLPVAAAAAVVAVVVVPSPETPAPSGAGVTATRTDRPAAAVYDRPTPDDAPAVVARTEDPEASTRSPTAHTPGDDPGADRRRRLRVRADRIADDVRVRQGYPEDADPVVQVEIPDGTGESNDVRVYGDVLDDPGDTIDATVEGLLGD
jgi:RNA polymerase sigma factor (sigma-70 family)